MSDEPTLKMPTGWEKRAPAGWEWETLWTAVEEGDHRFADKRTREAIEAGIDPRAALREENKRASVAKAHKLYMTAVREGRSSRAKRP